VNQVLDILKAKGLLLTPEFADEGIPAAEVGKRSKRDHVVNELLETERKYVQDLEALQQLQNLLSEGGTVTGDKIYDIFHNLNALLDFQRRFLIRVEQTNAQQMNMQLWGDLFVQYESGFAVYEPYLANKENGQAVAEQEFGRIKQVNHGIAAEMQTLSGFLLKPLQRLTKYPLLLEVKYPRTIR
jgi:cell division control protein 24